MARDSQEPLELGMVLVLDWRGVSFHPELIFFPSGSTGEGLSFERAVTALGCEKVEKPRNWAGATTCGHCQKNPVAWDVPNAPGPAVLMGSTTDCDRVIYESEF